MPISTSRSPQSAGGLEAQRSLVRGASAEQRDAFPLIARVSPRRCAVSRAGSGAPREPQGASGFPAPNGDVVTIDLVGCAWPASQDMRFAKFLAHGIAISWRGWHLDLQRRPEALDAGPEAPAGFHLAVAYRTNEGAHRAVRCDCAAIGEKIRSTRAAQRVAAQAGGC